MPESGQGGGSGGGLPGVVVDIAKWGIKLAGGILGGSKNPEVVMARVRDAGERLIGRSQPAEDPLAPVVVTAQHAATYATAAPRGEPRRGRARKKKTPREIREDQMRELGERGVFPYSLYWGSASPGQKATQFAAHMLGSRLADSGARVMRGTAPAAKAAPPMATPKKTPPPAAPGGAPGGGRTPPKMLPTTRAMNEIMEDMKQSVAQFRVYQQSPLYRAAPARSTVTAPAPPKPPPKPPTTSTVIADAGPGPYPANAVDTRPRQAAVAPSAPGVAAAPERSSATAAGSSGGAVLTVTGTPATRVSLAPLLSQLLSYGISGLAAAGVKALVASKSSKRSGSVIAPLPATSVATGSFFGSGGSFPGMTSGCECPKKKSKPRKPRNECWKGSYVETARGLKKVRRQLVPC